MAASALLLTASAVVRAASLNLCTDEYLLLLARPGEIVGISHLARDPLESPLAPRTSGIPGNDGTLDSVVALRPELVLTMGASGRSTAAIARRLGIRMLELPPPATLDDVDRNLARVAVALGDGGRARALRTQLAALRRTTPARQEESIFLSGGGLTLPAEGIGAVWMRLAGFRQRAVAGGRVSQEMLLVDPSKRLLLSRYRSGQMSRGQQWLRHPAVRRLAARTIATDGRRWTCMGPLMIGEIERLRRSTR